MRRTTRVLSVTALASAALGAAASAAFADPAADINPSSVEPGGTVAVSVSCDGVGGSAPDFIDAHSQGFEQGKVQLRRVTGNDGGSGGASYRGTARIPPGQNFDGGSNAVGHGSEWGVDGTCPVAPGDRERPWNAKYTVARGSSVARNTAERPVGVEHGARAGEGGSFTESLPALIIGGILVAGALGVAVYRAWQKGGSSKS